MPRRAAGEPTPVRTRRARGSLSRDEILDGAYQLVSRDGLAGLSMPILARHLDAGVTSIYWYFRNKEELLVALAERVTKDLYDDLPRIGPGPWDEELRRYFVGFRAVLARFPLYLELYSVRPRFVLSRPAVFPVVMKRLDQEVATLVSAGLPPAVAARAYYAGSVYTRGFVMLEQGLHHEPEELDESVHDELVRTVKQLDPDTFPALAAIGDLDAVTRLDDKEFERGLDLVLDGIRARVTQSRRAPPRRRARQRRTG